MEKIFEIIDRVIELYSDYRVERVARLTKQEKEV